MRILILITFSILVSQTLYAQDKTVRFAMWGGNENINNWVDDFVSVELKKQYGIILERVPVSDAQDVVQKLLRDKKLNRSEGSVDLLWVNGENFKVMKDNKLTWKPFLYELENSKFVNLNSSTILNDFGTQHEGHEMPWGSAQMVFIYDTAKVKTPPKTLKELVSWIKENPGKFTYSAPPDFTGSAFIRQTFMNLIGKDEYNQLINTPSEENLKQSLLKLWELLNDIEPFLYRKGEFYPESVSKLHQQFSDGSIWMTMDYYPSTAQRMIDKGVFPKTTRTFVLNEGALANTHFVTIPFNAPNKDSALIAANFLLSVKAQASKLDPKNWGDFSVLDIQKLSEEDKKLMQSIDLGHATLGLDELNNAKVQELPATFVPIIEAEWKKNIIQNQD